VPTEVIPYVGGFTSWSSDTLRFRFRNAPIILDLQY
jgi:hypothetical protein